MMMKRFAWIATVVAATVVSAAEVKWKLSSDTVDLERGTTCVKSNNGWTLSQPQRRIRCFSKEAFEIKPDAKYFVRIKVRGLAPKTRLWVVARSFDEKGREIPPTSVDCDANTFANLGAYIHPGTTEIQIGGAEKWPQTKRATVLVFNAQSDESDLPNFDYYAIKSIASDGTVTLASPLRRGYRAETCVRRHFRNGMYHSLIGSVLDTEFQANRRNISGISEKGCDFGHWLRGTVKVRIGIEAENDVEVAELVFTEITE